MLTYSAPSQTVTRNQGNAWPSVSAIEKSFPRISQEVCNLWQASEIDRYIDGLLLDDRGDRMGFPIEVLDKLMFLAGVRWHLIHLCGTVIQTTTAEPFDFTGNMHDKNVADSKTWVLI